MSNSNSRIYADEETSSPEYATRFAGPIGKWLLDVQAEIVHDYALRSKSEGCVLNALDVGGGHGQLIDPLKQADYDVFVLGSSQRCASLIKPRISRGEARFACSDLSSASFANRSFHLVTCIRLLTHCEAWRSLVAELCRLADHSVIIDYPPVVSFNFLYPILFKLKKRLEGNTRPFRLFTHKELVDEFRNHGFSLSERTGQFLFPMVCYRRLGNPKLAEAIEKPLKYLGLTSYLGSPALARFTRIA